MLIIMVPLIVGIGNLLLAVGHTMAIVVALLVMTAIAGGAVGFSLLPKPSPELEDAPISFGKIMWRVGFAAAALFIVGLTFFLTYSWITIMKMYPTVGLYLIVSGIIGTP